MSDPLLGLPGHSCDPGEHEFVTEARGIVCLRCADLVECAPLCRASSAYGRFMKPWQHRAGVPGAYRIDAGDGRCRPWRQKR